MYSLNCRFLALVLGGAVVAWSAAVSSAEFKPIELHPDYRHDRFVTQPKHVMFRFRAYTSSFAGSPSKPWGIPLWVAYELKKFPGQLGKGPGRPSSWITIRELARKKLAPFDATYRYSRAFRTKNKNWFVRGHLAMKQHAWRLGANADWNTHTVVNAVPQRDEFNRGIWLDLELKTAKWADKYSSVWIIAGPIFSSGQPRRWLGEKSKGEMLIAIPDALFKIVIRVSANPDRPHVLAFVYPQKGQSYTKSPFSHKKFLKSVDDVEKLTGLDFLTALPDADEKEVEKAAAIALWD